MILLGKIKKNYSVTSRSHNVKTPLAKVHTNSKVKEFLKHTREITLNLKLPAPSRERKFRRSRRRTVYRLKYSRISDPDQRAEEKSEKRCDTILSSPVPSDSLRFFSLFFFLFFFEMRYLERSSPWIATPPSGGDK